LTSRPRYGHSRAPNAVLGYEVCNFINTVEHSDWFIGFTVLSATIYIAILRNCIVKFSTSVSIENASLNVWLGFDPVLAQSRWLRASATLVNPWSGRMRAESRILISRYHSDYNCQNYCNRSLDSRLVLWTFHSVNLVVSPATLTSVGLI